MEATKKYTQAGAGLRPVIQRGAGLKPAPAAGICTHNEVFGKLLDKLSVHYDVDMRKLVML